MNEILVRMSLGSGGGRFVTSLALLSVVGAIGRAGFLEEGGGIAQAWATWPEGASAPNGTMTVPKITEVPEMA